MKRIAQFFTTSVALCLLVAGCGNPSARGDLSELFCFGDNVFGCRMAQGCCERTA